ncbi:hypothetical protein [Pararhizobium sp.]|uniref:hypothetical protein n=1 Tax=Pararhizobium sp. TaxID=1977563 RepID=UPI002715C36C|nr:hypothetical protein [Pararhizobium sp.]MDO9416973.1 hypothetical protein [Pararhizobium sp.]
MTFVNKEESYNKFFDADFRKGRRRWVPVSKDSVGGAYVTKDFSAVTAHVWAVKSSSPAQWFWKEGAVTSLSRDVADEANGPFCSAAEAAFATELFLTGDLS